MTDGPAQKALRASLRGLTPSDRDGAAIQLARRYAALLDAAALPASYRPALDRIARVVTAKADVNAVAKIRDALAVHTVAADLGPKYLAVLVQLGLTPAARSARAGRPVLAEPEAPAEPDEPAPKVAEGTADELRARRAKRAAGTG
jgi:hypothetical protein